MCKKVTESDLMPLWHQACEEYGWVAVVEDGAPAHKGGATQYRQLHEIEKIQWPAQCLDLNLIVALWLDMESELVETWGRIGDIPTV